MMNIIKNNKKEPEWSFTSTENKQTITIPLEHYNELLMIKGRYEELKIRYKELKNIYYEDIENSENNFEKKLRDNLIFDNLLNNI